MKELRYAWVSYTFYSMEATLPVRLKLDALLEKKGYTRQSFANKVGRKRQFISKLAGEQQPKRIDFDTMALLYVGLDCQSFDELFEHTEE
jgi:DNA-binding Xre family transcriptional regulator